MIIDDAINVYADGSSYSNPRKGGIGIRIITINKDGNEEINDIPYLGYKGATNNEMELTSCIFGIREAKKSEYFNLVKRIAVFSDSQYVINNYKIAIFEWSKNGWRNRYGRPIMNVNLWKDLIKEIKFCFKRVEFYWVKGHSKNIHNKAVNKLAQSSAKGILNPKKTIRKLRRKISYKNTIIGSIKAEGQRLSIHIISDEYLKTHKCYKYRYEVITKKSIYYKNVDIVFSSLLLNAGHNYYIQLNNNEKNPEIIKCFRELKKK